MILPRPSLVLSILALLFASVAASGQDAKPTEGQGTSEPAKPDRSAEGLFRKMLESHGKLKGLHVLMWNGRQDRPDYPFLLSSSQEFWYQDGATFRIEQASYFGGTTRIVCDGKTLMSDPMDSSRPVDLRKAGKSVIDSDSSLGLGRRSSSILFALLGGVAAFDSIVAANGVIQEAPSDGPLKALRVGFKSLGTATLYYAANDPLMLLRRVDSAGTPPTSRGSQAEAAPESTGESGAPAPQPQAVQRIVRQNLYYVKVGAKLPPALFSTEVPKGIRVNDLRAEKPQSSDTGPFSSDPPDEGFEDSGESSGA